MNEYDIQHTILCHRGWGWTMTIDLRKVQIVTTCLGKLMGQAAGGYNKVVTINLEYLPGQMDKTILSLL
jgi:hypothetical protein